MNDIVSPFEIGIIGGNGAMGKWFAAFFRKNGYTVHIADQKTVMTIPELAGRCAVVIVSVPIDVTESVIREAGTNMGPDGLLMDLTSLKTVPVSAMLQATPSEVIGLHPLFGPDTASIRDQNIVVCPARGTRWLSWLTALLKDNGAHIVETTPERHDEMMSVIQGLNHLNTIMMGLTIQDAAIAPDELDLYSTPAFRTKREMIKKTFHQNPAMYAEIIANNPHIGKILHIYEANLARLKKLINDQDIDSLTELMKSQS
ncbi:MAG: prephenate dehydrogenase [Syntrophus sp. SKADARSKE-3]|nr:prephenate dehydrogenase [Syntrophus sp. SKADARSKE-3]